MDYQQIIMLLGGIGLLLFAMNVFESAIKVLGKQQLKNLLQKFTKSSWGAIGTGTLVTGLLQSSSLVSLLVLAFVGAGVMQLSNAIGVIIGANIGTTMTSLLIAWLGFGKLKISAIALPIIAAGGISLIFAKSEKTINRAKLLVGFGLLFLGIDFMKESVDVLKESIDITAWQGMSLRGFGLVGVITTLILQSSSAVGVMTITALSGGIITFPASFAIVMGSNIGTTITAVIGSLGGAMSKRQVALSHVLFNIGSALLGIIFFNQYIWLVLEGLGFASNPVMGNAVLNTLFNTISAIIFGIFLVPFTKLIKKLTKHTGETEETIQQLRIEQTISGKDDTFALPQLYALHEDSKTLIDQVFAYNIHAFGLKSELLMKHKTPIEDIIKDNEQWDKQKHADDYAQAKHIADIMLENLLPNKLKKLSKTERHLTEHIEKSIYAASKSAKSIKNIYHDLQDIRTSSNPILRKVHKKILLHAATFYKHVAAIIDRDYNKDNFVNLVDALKEIKKDHKHFIDYITKQLSKETTKKDFADIDVPTLLNIDHYLYQSCKRLANAIQHAYLTKEEAKVFKGLEVAEESEE